MSDASKSLLGGHRKSGFVCAAILRETPWSYRAVYKACNWRSIKLSHMSRTARQRICHGREGVLLGWRGGPGRSPTKPLFDVGSRISLSKPLYKHLVSARSGFWSSFRIPGPNRSGLFVSQMSPAVEVTSPAMLSTSQAVTGR